MADRMSIGERVVLLAIEPGSLGIKLASHRQIAFITGLTTAVNRLSCSTHMKKNTAKPVSRQQGEPVL